MRASPGIWQIQRFVPKLEEAIKRHQAIADWQPNFEGRRELRAAGEAGEDLARQVLELARRRLTS